MTKPNVSSATPAVREAFESIMGVFERVSGGQPKKEHQETIREILDRLEYDAYQLGVGGEGQ